MKLINIPIEPIEERYSIQWDRWFKVGFTEGEVPFETVYGEKTSGKINTGSFLDVVETNLYKTSQLYKIINILKTVGRTEKIVLFFHDLWFPGLPTIAYIKAGLGLKNVKICGCLHAGSYDRFDFLSKMGMSRWAEHSENSWFGGIVDEIFVATGFHKKLITSMRKVPFYKIHVTGFPIYPSYNLPVMENKKDIIVFPHRLDSEKNPERFNHLITHFPSCEFIKTKEVCKSKKEYYNLLGAAKIAISTADQETWGIAMQEAVFQGCVPIVPNKLSYKEMYFSDFRYDRFSEMVEKIKYFLHQSKITKGLVTSQQNLFIKAGENAIPNMIEIIKNL